MTIVTQTFDQFSVGGTPVAGDTIVGLRSGINTQFTYPNVANIIDVQYAIDTNLDGIYNNGVSGIGASLTATAPGVLIIDLEAPLLGDLVLVAQQTNAYEGGIYKVVDTGTILTPWVLERYTAFDQPAEINLGQLITVLKGNAFGGSIFVILTPSNPIIGINPIAAFSMLSSAILKFGFLQASKDLSDVSSPSFAFNNIAPTTTKGEMIVNDGSSNVSLPISIDGYVLKLNSSTLLGVEWAPESTELNFTAKGQLLTYDGSVTAYLNAGANGTVLMADSTQADGIKWFTPNWLVDNFTAKGELLTFDGSFPTIVTVGPDGYVLKANSSFSGGMAWEQESTELNFTAKGQLVTYTGSAVAYLNAGTDGYCLIADSTQPDGLRWATGATPVFTYPYTFTGQTLFDLTPTMNYATANQIAFYDSSKNLTGNANFQYNSVLNQFIHCVSPGSITDPNVAVVASSGAAFGATRVFAAASSTPSITSVESAIIASGPSSIMPLGDHNLIAACGGGLIDLTSNNCAIIASNAGTISNTSLTSGIFAADGTVGGFHSALIASNSSTITGNNSGIFAGYLSSVVGNYSFAIGRSANVLANTSGMLSDGSTAYTLSLTQTLALMFTRGVGINTTTPPDCAALTVSGAGNKGFQNPTVASYAAIVSPTVGLQVFDTTLDQLMIYKSTGWQIAA